MRSGLCLRSGYTDRFRGCHFGRGAAGYRRGGAERIQEILPVRLHSAHANLTALPYEDASFDKIVCISVLEHLTPEESLATLHEFHRTIRDDGMLLLTFDYPTVDLSAMEQWIEQAGFSYWNGVDLNLPRGALHTDMWGGLHCFRTVLKNIRVSGMRNEVYTDLSYCLS